MFSPLGNQVMSKIICKFCNFQKLLQKFHVNIYDFLLPIFKILQRFLLSIYHVTYLPWIFSPIVFKHLFIAPIQLVPSRWNIFMDSSPVQRPTTSKTSCRIFYISSDQNNTPRMLISHSSMKCSWRPFLVLLRFDWCWLLSIFL